MKLRENTALVVVMILVAAMTRLIPHYPNFTAVGAVALFGGAYLSRRMAFIIPIVALFISDLFLNNLIYAKQFPEFYDGFMFFNVEGLPVYGAFVVIILIGIFFIKKATVKNVLGSAVLASVIFFLITNFAVWAGSVIYPKSFAGLITCFTAAVPFFWNTLLGNVFFVAVLFGGYEWVRSRQLRAVVSD
jgi:uncharacterized protein DUF6580